ncbi:MAG: hypothetical protein MUO42_08615 [Anaerolineaceae bacterium]|nr:hypothetical protein [Anaerolineaceae bacterium]
MRGTTSLRLSIRRSHRGFNGLSRAVLPSFRFLRQMNQATSTRWRCGGFQPMTNLLYQRFTGFTTPG